MNISKYLFLLCLLNILPLPVLEKLLNPYHFERFNGEHIVGLLNTLNNENLLF